MRITPQQSSGGGGAYGCEADVSYRRCSDGAAHRSASCFWVGDTLIRPELFSLSGSDMAVELGNVLFLSSALFVPLTCSLRIKLKD